MGLSHYLVTNTGHLAPMGTHLVAAGPRTFASGAVRERFAGHVDCRVMYNLQEVVVIIRQTPMQNDAPFWCWWLLDPSLFPIHMSSCRPENRKA